MIATIVLAAVLGACLGSFVNVVAFRLPAGESLVAPGSHCRACGTAVRPYDNVPVLSWLVLRGRCRRCRARISVRYPLVEAATAGLFAAVVAAGGGRAEVILGLVFVALLVPVALIDLEHRIIPNRLLWPVALLGVALVAVLDPSSLPERAIAAAAAGGFLFVAALAYPGGMGMGDVKLAAVMGLFLGSAVAPAMLAGMLAGTVVGVGIMARRGVHAGRKVAVPFGPFLAAGGLVGLFAGGAIVHWYLTTFA
jgi:leader peptidase (prepilin peptidase)/N-methyltransferase